MRAILSALRAGVALAEPLWQSSELQTSAVPSSSTTPSTSPNSLRAPSLKLRLRRRSRKKRHLRPWKANHRREALTILRSGSESHTDRSSSPRSRKANRKFAPATRMDVQPRNPRTPTAETANRRDFSNLWRRRPVPRRREEGLGKALQPPVSDPLQPLVPRGRTLSSDLISLLVRPYVVYRQTLCHLWSDLMHNKV